MKFLKQLVREVDERHPPIPATQVKRNAQMTDPDTVDSIMSRMESADLVETLDVLQYTLSLLNDQQLRQVDDYVAEYVK